MNIVYYCFAGAHASVVASAIHCGLLPVEHVPTYDEFVALPYYDRTAPRLIGSPYLMGRDEYGHNVYFLGLWDQRLPIMAAVGALLATASIDEQDYFFQDAFPLINFSTKIGGLLSKRYCLTSIGRRITVWGMQRQYPAFVSMVADVKSKLHP
ncbi:DUF3189 family protein [Anaeroselena agilis]|uniref:DUF3189 family protein n=1 Tax=Anaeroselena agilis TaxID=3063788 RepID=A0ABU3NWL0_9FIRM|nr:DUF3189 family protein [Selenomonadales bacterium 4137-cl]